MALVFLVEERPGTKILDKEGKELEGSRCRALHPSGFGKNF